MGKKVVGLLGLLAAIAGLSAYYSQRFSPEDARRLRTAEVYTTVLEGIISTAKDPSKIKEIYIFGETDVGAVPTLQARLQEGLSQQQARDGLAHQRAKFDRAMKQIHLKPETLADFEASNSATELLDLPLSLSRPHHWVQRDQESIPRDQVVVALSGVGFNHEMNEAAMTLNFFMMRQDYRLTRTAEHQWKVSDASGGRFVMD